MSKSVLKNKVFAIIAVVAAIMSGCALFSNENDNCDATKMITPEEPVIYLRAWLDADLMNTTSGSYYLKYATKLQLIGSVEKEYCSGKRSGKFEFNPTFFPAQMTTAELTAGLYLPQPYQYKFDNDKDRLIVMVSLKAWFSDGKIFESDHFPDEFFFKDIKYDVNTLKSYIKLDYSSPATPWKQVTSK